MSESGGVERLPNPLGVHHLPSGPPLRQVGFLFSDLDHKVINLIGFVETSTLLLDDLLDGIRLNPAHARMIEYNVKRLIQCYRLHTHAKPFLTWNEPMNGETPAEDEHRTKWHDRYWPTAAGRDQEIPLN